MPKTKKRPDGRYQASLYLGRDETGKRKYKTFYGTSQRAVDAARQEYREMLGRGLDPDSRDKTFGELSDWYVTLSKAKDIGPKTLQGIESDLAKLERFRPVAVRAIRPEQIQQVLNELADWHDGKPPMAASSIRKVANTMRNVLGLAVPDILQQNPMSPEMRKNGRIVYPHGNGTKKVSFLRPEQRAWVEDTPHRAQTAAMIMMYAGLRRGELIALTWGDVDTKKRTITVNKNAVMVNNAATVKFSAKTEAGTRTVDIPQNLANYLEANRDNSLYVIHQKNGKMHTLSSFRALWRSYMRDLNIKYAHPDTNKNRPGGVPITLQTFTPHQLRHTFCSIMYMAGVDAVTAKQQMGHSNIKTTLQIYTDLDRTYKRRTMDRLDAYLDECKSDASHMA